MPHEPKPVGVVGEKPAIEGSILKSDFADTTKNNKKAKRKAASRQKREVAQNKLPYSIALSEVVPPVQKPVINVEIGPAPGGGTELKYVHVASGEVLFVWNPVAKRLEPVGDIVNRPAASSEVEQKPIGQKLDSTQSGGVIQRLIRLSPHKMERSSRCLSPHKVEGSFKRLSPHKVEGSFKA